MKILITGAGGPAAISVWKSLHKDHTVLMADMDAKASGLYLVPAERRFLLPRGDAAHFTEELFKICHTQAIEVCIPTVDSELAPVSAQSKRFSNIGTAIPLAHTDILALCRDKGLLIPKVAGLNVPVPQGGIWGGPGGISSWNEYPAFAKPCKGSGSNGLVNIYRAEDLALIPKDGSYLLQELLPFEEYSVDVYAHPTNGGVKVQAAVVRERMKTDSGIAITARTRIHEAVQRQAIQVVEGLGLSYVSNVQFKRAKDGQYKFLEVNPRFPGSLPLTQMAGIDIPKLVVASLSAKNSVASLLEYKEVMMVRYWIEHEVPYDEYRALMERPTK